MAPRERKKPFHFLHTSDGKQILNSLFPHFHPVPDNSMVFFHFSEGVRERDLQDPGREPLGDGGAQRGRQGQEEVGL